MQTAETTTGAPAAERPSGPWRRVRSTFASDNGLLWFAVGAVIALPVLRFHGNVTSDADSTRLLANVQYMKNHGVGYLRETQEVVVPHITYWITSTVGGIGVARWVPLFSYIALSGVVAFIGRKWGGSALTGIVAPIALICFAPLQRQGKILPLYSLMLAFGFLSAYFAERVRHATTRKGQWGLAFVTAALIVLAAESHATGQLFLFVPVLMVFFGRWRPLAAWKPRVVAMAQTLVALGVLFLPRLLINLSVRGTSRLRTNYDFYFIRKGYLDIVNESFWEYPVNTTMRQYVRTFLEMLQFNFRWYVVPVIVLAAIGFFTIKGSAKFVALLAAAVVAGGILSVRPSPFPRYALPLAPGIAVLCAIGVDWIVRRLPRRAGRATGVALVGALSVAAVWTLVNTGQWVRWSDDNVVRGPLPVFSTLMNDGKGVAGVRSPQLLFIREDVDVFGPVSWTEEQYVRYLTWPSDEAVLEQFARDDIGWVFVTGDGQRINGVLKSYEVDYPGAWLEASTGQRPRHLEMIRQSPNFCLMGKQPSAVDPTLFFELYKVGPCAEGEGVSA